MLNNPKHVLTTNDGISPSSSATLTLVPPWLADQQALLDIPASNMDLLATARTNEAVAAVTTLVGLIYPTRTKKRASPQYIAAVTAMAADLLRAANHDPPRPCYRPLRVDSFTGAAVTYAPFKKTLHDLVTAGFVTIMKGKGALGRNRGVTTRIWSTPKFTDHFATAGITVGNWRSHFDRAFDATKVPPLRLKARSIRKGGWKLEGRRMEVDFSNPLAAALAEPVRQINAFVAKQDISGAGDVAFFRTFNCGDDRRFGWSMGGRLCCVGGGYQSMKKAMRPSIRINGEETAELDVSGSHLTILYALRGMPLPAGNDPYAGTSLPRHVIKAFINMTLGHTRFHSRWPAEVKDRYKDDHGGDLQREYPIRIVMEEVIALLPIMADWPECLITWADLQYTESCIVTAAVHRLAYEQNICTLPLHDSLIFPASKREIVEQYLRKCFYEYTGINPNLKVKG